MKLLNRLVFVIGLSLPITVLSQAPDLGWIVELTEEIVNETDLCERCTWVNPTITKVLSGGGETYYFLRYSCSTSESFARMYDVNGSIVGECASKNGTSDCGFGFNAFTVYTFADDIQFLWNCTTDFDCEFALENNIERTVPIAIDDSRCVEGIKILRVSEEFSDYNWQGENKTGTQAALVVDTGGTYFVTVADATGCTLEGQVNIPDIQALDVKIKGASTICASTSATLTTTNFQSYQWSTASTEPSIVATQAGIYEVTVTNEQNCQGSASFTLDYFEPIDLSIGTTASTVEEGDSTNVFVETSPNTLPIIAYEWQSELSVACKDCSATSYLPQAGIPIQVSVTDAEGCLHTAMLSIEVKKRPLDLYAPNVFMPNSFGNNSIFTIYGASNVQTIETLTIFDRWGNQVFSNANFPPNQLVAGWDGRSNGQNSVSDVYVFWARALFTNGEKKMIEGDVLLLR